MEKKYYVLRFDDEADGGPETVLYKLRGFTLRFVKDGATVAEGMVDESEQYDEVVVVRPYNEKTGDHDLPGIRLNIYGGFDEVVYL